MTMHPQGAGVLPPRWTRARPGGSLQRDDGLLLEPAVRGDDSPIADRIPITAHWYVGVVDGPIGETYPDLLGEETVWSGAPGDAPLTAIEGADARWPLVEAAAVAFALIKRPSLAELGVAFRARRASIQEAGRAAVAHHAAITAERDALRLEVARLMLAAPAAPKPEVSVVVSAETKRRRDQWGAL